MAELGVSNWLLALWAVLYGLWRLWRRLFD